MIEIREATLFDSEAMASLYHNTIHHINSRHYDPVQIETWGGAAPDPEKWRPRLATRQTFVAYQQDKLVGFTELEADGHVDTLFVHHEHQGEGVATRLLAHVEQLAERVGISRLYTEASITARPFFERRGFVVVRPQEVEIRGVWFRNYKMEKVLSS